MKKLHVKMTDDVVIWPCFLSFYYNHAAIFLFCFQLNGHYVMSILMLSMGYAMAASIQGLVTCSQKDAKCGSNPDEQIALHAILVAVVVVGFFMSITSMVLHLRNRSILHPDWKYGKGCCGKADCDK